MTKIKTYSIKNPVADADKWIGSAGDSGITKNFTAQDVSDYVKSQLTPIEGGILAVTEIDIDTLDTDIATTVNAMSPSYDVAPYELVHFVIEGRVYILKVVDSTIGVGGTSLTNEDFITLPVNTGPTGPTGDTGNGIDNIELIETSGVVNTYRITYTDSGYFDFDVTDGVDGLNADMFRTSSDTLTIANSGTITISFITPSDNLGFINGMRLRIFNSAGTYMEGVVSGFTSSSVTVDLDYSVGSGPYSDWYIGVAGDPGNTVASQIYYESTSGTLNITSQSNVDLKYDIYFQKDNGKVFISGTITNNSSSTIGATELLTFTDSTFSALETYLFGNADTTNSTNYCILAVGNTINILDDILSHQTVYFNTFYYID